MRTTLLKLTLVTLIMHFVGSHAEATPAPTNLSTTSDYLQKGDPLVLKSSSRSSSSKRTVVTTTSKSGKKDKYGMGSFILGCVLIPFSLVLLWKNEKKLVTYAKVMATAKEEC